MRRLSGSIIFAMENVKFRHGVGDGPRSGGKLVGGSVAIVVLVENGCIMDNSTTMVMKLKLNMRTRKKD